MNIRHIVHIILHNLDDVFAEIGIYIAPIQSVVLIEMLLWHTKDASHGLSGESKTLYLSEDEEHCGTRAVPSQSDGLLEEQHFGQIIRFLYTIQILLFVAEPYRQLAIVNIDILDGVQILHHLFLDAFIILIHLILIIRQLNKQQRIDMNTYLAISLSQLFPFLQGKTHQMLVQRAIRIRKVQGRIQYHALFNHTFSNNCLSWNLHIQITFCFRGCRDTKLNFWIDVLQHLLCLVGEFAGKHVLFVDDNDDRNILFFLGSTSKIIE